MSKRYYDVYWQGEGSQFFQYGDYVNSFDMPGVYSKKSVRKIVAGQLRELGQNADSTDLRLVQVSKTSYDEGGGHASDSI